MFAEILYGQSLVIARIGFKIQWVFQSYVMSPLRIAFGKICIFEPGCQQRRRSCCWSSWCASAFEMLSWGLCKLTWVILLWKQRDWRMGDVVQGPKICTGMLLQDALKLVSLFGFKNADLVAPCIAWAALLRGNMNALFDLESCAPFLWHPPCTALRAPCPSWLLHVWGPTLPFGSSSMQCSQPAR